jgi:hypothetical protein
MWQCGCPDLVSRLVVTYFRFLYLAFGSTAYMNIKYDRHRLAMRIVREFLGILVSVCGMNIQP